MPGILGAGPLGTALREAALDALAVLLPVTCAGCGRADRALCRDCRVACAVAPGPRSTTVQVLSGVIPVVSALRYDGAVRATILAFKESGRTDVARPLSAALRVAIEEAARIAEPSAERPRHPELELCTVPSTREGQRRRGYRPVDLLLRSAGFRADRVLATAATATQQKALGREERGVNLRGSLRARRRLDGRRFVLVDDIVTTGATLSEAARAVREAGGEVLACASLAFTPLRIAPHGPLLEPARDIHSIGGYGV